MRNIRVSFREPLETHAARPAAGLCARPAVLLRPSLGPVHLFHGVVALLLDSVAPLLAVFPYISVLGLCRHVSYVNALQNRDIGGKKKDFMALWFGIRLKLLPATFTPSSLKCATFITFIVDFVLSLVQDDPVCSLFTKLMCTNVVLGNPT